MDFHCTDTIKHPIDIVWPTMRDRLPEIAEMQDDIEYVKVTKRDKKDPKSHHVISTWRADPPLPSFLKGFIKPDMLIWVDDAEWDNETTTCHFDITPNYQVEHIKCVGTIRFEPAARGRSTKIIYSGTLTIERTGRSSIFMTGFIIRGIEAVASKVIEHNFDKVVKALDRTIREK